MTPKKLSESDRQDILNAYRLPEETTSTLASRYAVSTSTISRILKNGLSEQEYESLIQQKRQTRSHDGAGTTDVPEPLTEPQPSLEEPPAPLPSVATPVSSEPTAASRRQRKRSSAVGQTEVIATDLPQQIPLDISTELPQQEILEPSQSTQPDSEIHTFAESDQTEPIDATHDAEAAALVKEMLREDLLDDEGDLADLDDEDEEDLDDDELEDDLDEDDLDDGPLFEGEDLQELPAIQVHSETVVQVLPLSEASVPKTFYLVVDRAAELITRPLRDFGVLGQIPMGEIQERTLPIFDNHRVARRFSKKTQRVIKVPDGKMLQKVSPHLQAKGITRLLIDGQVYSI